MADRKPAEIVRAAAVRLRKMARAAHAAPWAPDEDETGRGWDLRSGDDAHLAFGLTHADAHWSALVHPGLAEPLAALLDEFGDAMRDDDAEERHFPGHIPLWQRMVCDFRGEGRQDWTWALRIARVIMGEVAT